MQSSRFCRDNKKERHKTNTYILMVLSKSRFIQNNNPHIYKQKFDILTDYISTNQMEISVSATKMYVNTKAKTTNRQLEPADISTNIYK